MYNKSNVWTVSNKTFMFRYCVEKFLFVYKSKGIFLLRIIFMLNTLLRTVLLFHDNSK